MVHEIGGHAEVIADIVAVSPIGFLCLAQLCFELFDTTRVGAQFPADEQTDNNSREEATCYYNPGHSGVLGLRGFGRQWVRRLEGLVTACVSVGSIAYKVNEIEGSCRGVVRTAVQSAARYFRLIF